MCTCVGSTVLQTPSCSSACNSDQYCMYKVCPVNILTANQQFSRGSPRVVTIVYLLTSIPFIFTRQRWLLRGQNWHPSSVCMAVPDASGAPLMDRDPIHSNLKNSKHSSHRRRSRKHFPLSTMPHSHRGKRKLQLDLESEWDYTDTTPWIEGASDDYSSLESNCCNLREQNPATLPNLRKLCEDFSFSLDSLNDNLGTQPPPLNWPTSPPCTVHLLPLWRRPSLA